MHETLVEQGDEGNELFLVVDGVLVAEVDGEEVAEIGPARFSASVQPSKEASEPPRCGRRGDDVVATGQLSSERSFEVGDRVEITGHYGIVREVVPSLRVGAFRFVVQLLHEPDDEQ